MLGRKESLRSRAQPEMQPASPRLRWLQSCASKRACPFQVGSIALISTLPRATPAVPPIKEITTDPLSNTFQDASTREAERAENGHLSVRSRIYIAMSVFRRIRAKSKVVKTTAPQMLRMNAFTLPKWR